MISEIRRCRAEAESHWPYKNKNIESCQSPLLSEASSVISPTPSLSAKHKDGSLVPPKEFDVLNTLPETDIQESTKNRNDDGMTNENVHGNSTSPDVLSPTLDDHANSEEKAHHVAPPDATRKFKMKGSVSRVAQKIKSKIGKSMKRLKGNGALKSVFGMKTLAAPEQSAAPEKSSSHTSNDVEIKQTFSILDEKFARELVGDGGEDELDILRARTYVETGRRLLEEAAEFKEKNSDACRALTRKAYTYAYAARQIMKRTLLSRKAEVEGNLDTSTSDDDASKCEERSPEDDEEAKAWQRKLEDLELFSLEDLFSLLCYNSCFKNTVDPVKVEYDEALEILAQLSEEEFMLSTNRSIISTTQECVDSPRPSGADLPKETPQQAAVKEVVTNLQGFYETYMKFNSNDIGLASTFHELTRDLSEISKRPAEAGTHLKNTNGQDKKFSSGVDDELEEESQDDETAVRKSQSGYSYAYSESLQFDDASSYSQSVASDGASFASSGKPMSRKSRSIPTRTYREERTYTDGPSVLLKAMEGRKSSFPKMKRWKRKRSSTRCEF